MRLVKTHSALLLAVLLSPSLALAAGPGDLTMFEGTVASLGRMVNMLMPIVVGVLFIVFVYGVIMFIVKGKQGDEAGRKDGKNIILMGIVAMFVVSSIWGIVKLMQRFFGIENDVQNGGAIQVPTVQGITGPSRGR